MRHTGTPFTNRECCDELWCENEEEEGCCERDAAYVIFATFETEGGEVSVHAPMYVCKGCFEGRLPKYAQEWTDGWLLTLTVVPLAPTRGISLEKGT